MTSQGRHNERGMALLLVFVMAAAVAIMLYMELPRAAFESQRMREEMLIERGQQYMRGIQLYVAKNKRYPPTMDDLEKTGTIHYLRKRYKDPMTGEEEWRIIHTDGVRLTDSKVQKPDTQKKDTYQNTFISEGPAIGSTNPTGGTGTVNMATRRRPSDQAPLPGMGSAVEPQEGPGGVPPAPTDPNAPTPADQPQGMPGMQPGQPGQPGQPVQTGGPGQAGEGGPPTLPGQPGTPGQPQPGQVIQPQPGGNAPSPFSQLPSAQPNQPGAVGTQPIGATQNSLGGSSVANPSDAASSMINNMLRRPTTQTASGTTNTLGGQPGGALGGGIAGVASKLEADSIKIYNERQKYDEWEFVYDFSKDKKRGGGNANAAGGGNRQGNNQTQSGTDSKSNSSGFSPRQSSPR